MMMMMMGVYSLQAVQTCLLYHVTAQWWCKWWWWWWVCTVYRQYRLVCCIVWLLSDDDDDGDDDNGCVQFTGSTDLPAVSCDCSMPSTQLRLPIKLHTIAGDVRLTVRLELNVSTHWIVYQYSSHCITLCVVVARVTCCLYSGCRFDAVTSQPWASCFLFTALCLCHAH